MEPGTFVKPMQPQESSAKSLAKVDLSKYAAETKHDGYRIQIHRDGEAVRFFSRKGLEWSYASLEWLRGLSWPTRMILDAELVVPGGIASDVGHALTGDGSDLEVWVFDVLFDGDDLTGEPYEVRHEWATSIVEAVNHPKVHVVPSVMAEDRESVRSGEGVVLKALGSTYEVGARPVSWIKMKSTLTVDVIVTDCKADVTRWTVKPGGTGTDGVVYPEGKPSSSFLAGFVGLSYGYMVDGKAVRVGSLGTTGPRAEMEKFVGLVAEVKCYAVFNGGRLRHPNLLRWRDDKSPQECVIPAVN